MPRGGIKEIVLFLANRISLPGKPFAWRRPSTNNARFGLNRTVVPGRIVRVTPGRTMTFLRSTYTVSVGGPQVVSEVTGPPTYVVAAARGNVKRMPVRDIAAKAKTIATLGHR